MFIIGFCRHRPCPDCGRCNDPQCPDYNCRCR